MKMVVRNISRVIQVIGLLSITLERAECFSSPLEVKRNVGVLLHASGNQQSEGEHVSSRRSALQQGLLGFAAAAFATSATAANPVIANAAEDIRGIPLSPFNGLIFNYKGSDFSGLDPSSLNEPSVSYQEFVQKLKGGKVSFVEFLAPYGDAAYVTFKDGDGKPIRIGEGYPIEQHDGWSSPAFAIRTAVNEGVPYKFTVPALTKFK